MRRAQRTDSRKPQDFQPSLSGPAAARRVFSCPQSTDFQMIIVLKREATQEDADEILGRIEEKGLKPLYMPGTERVVLGALGDERVLSELGLDGHPMVESIKPILSPYKLVSREMHPHDTIVRVGKANIGGVGFAVIAGPCAVETEARLRSSAQAVSAAGAIGLRAGAYKQRI